MYEPGTSFVFTTQIFSSFMPSIMIFFFLFFYPVNHLVTPWDLSCGCPVLGATASGDVAGSHVPSLPPAGAPNMPAYATVTENCHTVQFFFFSSWDAWLDYQTFWVSSGSAGCAVFVPGEAGNWVWKPWISAPGQALIFSDEWHLSPTCAHTHVQVYCILWLLCDMALQKFDCAFRNDCAECREEQLTVNYNNPYSRT